MSKEIDKWITDHAYAPDDIVLGDGVTSISDRWLTSLHELLDIARPGWRSLFDRPIHEQCGGQLRRSTSKDAGVEGDDALFPWCCDRCNVLVALDEDPVIESEAAGAKLADDLRELLSYCEERTEYKGRDNEIGADTAYGDVATRLTKILDGAP